MILSATITLTEGAYAWTGTVELGDPASFQRVKVNDPITLEMGGESFNMVVDNKTLSRNGVNRPRLTLSLISLTARFAKPRATPMERTWNTPVLAQDAAEEAVGESIQWDLVNWTIPGDRLAVHNAAPVDVVSAIAKAAGGLVETTPGGVLRVRHRFPVAVPLWDQATPDHTLTDATDNLSCQESHRHRSRVNRVLVRGYLPSSRSGYLSAEVDRRDDGLNQGRTTFHPGETAHMLVYHDPKTTIQDISASTGLILPNADQIFQRSEDITFDETGTAFLSRPATAIQSVIWMGSDLGVLTLAPDGRTVTAASIGITVARVTFTVRARSWRLSTPSTVAGLDSFSVRVQIAGSSRDEVGDGEIVCERGRGEFPGVDISDPLLATTDAKLSRGRAEIDAGEALQEVSMTCVQRSGVMPGNLVEVHDAMMGRSWRGKVVSVTHTAHGPMTTTSLDLRRHVPD